MDTEEFNQNLELLVLRSLSTLRILWFENGFVVGFFLEKSSHRRAPDSIGEREFTSNDPWIPIVTLKSTAQGGKRMGKRVGKWKFLWKLADLWAGKHCIAGSWTIYRLKWCRSRVNNSMEIPKFAISDSFVHKLPWNSWGIFPTSWALVPVPVGLVWNLAALFPPIPWQDGKCRNFCMSSFTWALQMCSPLLLFNVCTQQSSQELDEGSNKRDRIKTYFPRDR